MFTNQIGDHVVQLSPEGKNAAEGSDTFTNVSQRRADELKEKRYNVWISPSDGLFWVQNAPRKTGDVTSESLPSDAFPY